VLKGLTAKMRRRKGAFGIGLSERAGRFVLSRFCVDGLTGESLVWGGVFLGR
jgi:hypothetical protein